MISYRANFWIFCTMVVALLSHAQAQQVVNVRSGDHPNFSRVVFDWTERVDYQTRLEDGHLEISFDRPGTPQWNNLDRTPLTSVNSPSYRVEEGRLVVRFELPGPVQLMHFRSGTKVVFDISPDQPALSLRIEKAQDTSVGEDLTEGAPARPYVEEEHLEDISPLLPEEGALLLEVERQNNSMRLRYPWENSKAAAAFVRHNHLWVVFEGYRPVDQSRLDRYLGQGVLSAQQLDHPSMTVLNYRIAPDQNVKMQRIGKTWQIDIKGDRTAPTTSIPSGHKRAIRKQGENYFFSVKDAGSVVIVTDPVIGDELAIVPVLASSKAVLQTQTFSEFEALETAQGIAVQLIADDLSVTKNKNGVIISSLQGLALSPSQMSSQLTIDITDGDESEMLVDFTSWAKGPLEGQVGYYANKHELLYQLANATDTDRNEKRWRLARYYLANGRAREAYGVLNVMLDQDSYLTENPIFRTVLGVTNILMRRFEAGAALLTHKSLIAEPDTYLWRAVAHSEMGLHRQALDDFLKGADVLSFHQPDDRVRFLFAAIRSAYTLDDIDFVESALSILRKLPLNAVQMTEVDYWQALLERDKGNPLQAEEDLKNIVKAGVRKTSAWARLELVNQDLLHKKLTTAQAIDQLEKLRFSWRGGDFELELLSRLGDLYVAQKDFYTGLQTLKLAVTFFKGSNKVGDLTRQMNRIYRDLFLNGEADVMEPVRAVALYSEFRELIPLGTEGDNMSRRLADRLVSIDLLEEAEALLDHQIKFRLKGGAQAVVASRLAMIYLLDSKPAEALAVLRATRDSQIPVDVQDRRNMIEVRTLIELDRFEEAEVMLEPYHTKEADELRSDVYWKSEDWGKYIAHSNRLLGKRYLKEEALSPKERLAVLRLSVAYVINDDKPGVKILRDRYKGLMDEGMYSDTFEVITAEQQLTDSDVRRLTKSIASVAQLTTFMESYRAEFTDAVEQN